MMRFELVLNRLNILLLSLILLIGLWRFDVFFIPVLTLSILTMFIDIINNRNQIFTSYIILFILILLNEIVNYTASEYKANSILFLKDLFQIISCIILFYKLFKCGKIKNYFIVFISIMAGVLTLANIPIFFFRYYESAINGFEDFSQFRFLYKPLTFLSNDWVTILLCLLPFPVIGSLYYWKKTLVRYCFIFIFGLIVFNILITFSRAGILSFLLFIILLNILVICNHLFPVKKIVIFDAILLLMLFIFAFFFSESVCSSIQQTYSHQRSTEGRLQQWEQAFNMIGNTPYLGVGSKNYALLSSSHQQMDLQNSFTGRVNNTYIQLLIEKGLVGFFIWAYIIIYILFIQIKDRKKRLDKTINCILISAILSILFRELFFSSLLYNSCLLLLFFILIIFNLKDFSKNVIIRKSIAFGASALFLFGAIYSYSKKSDDDNALMYAEKGLKCERFTKTKICFDSLCNNPNYQIEIKQNAITLGIKFYKEACRLNSFDAMFHHNLGWLYWMNSQYDLAYDYISQAVKLDPNDALYHVSKGLITESINIEEAFESYMKAILISPDIIDSFFFNDLNRRLPVETNKLLEMAYNELKQMISSQYSSILEAKSGKLLLALGEISQAHEIFNHVTQVHPNLSRPWYYLGLIEQKNGNYCIMREHFKKSLFLSSDYLPLYAFAYYYKEIGDMLKSDSYFKNADRIWKNKRSIHSSRSKRIYFLDTEKDDIIPEGLFEYIIPVFCKDRE